MSRYDEERVVALLRDSVPAVPDVADRLAAVRARARRQRAQAWTQVLGATVAVLLLVGAASALGRPGGGERVRPLANPIEAMGEALLAQRSVSFEARTELVGDPPAQLGGVALPAGHVAAVMSSRVTGAATAGGDLTLDGDASILRTMFLFEGAVGGLDATYDMRVRIVGGRTYRSPDDHEQLTPGKRWVAEPSTDGADVTALRPLVRMLRGVAEDVEYTGQGTVRGTPVAEYRLTIPRDVTGSTDVVVRFALDEENRPRRIWTELSWLDVFVLGDVADDGPAGRPRTGELTVRLEVELFGYGEDVRVTPPPASEVVEMDDVEYGGGGFGGLDGPLADCLREAGDDAHEQGECFEEHGVAPGDPQPTPSCSADPDGGMTCTFGGYAGGQPPAPPQPSPSGHTEWQSAEPAYPPVAPSPAG